MLRRLLLLSLLGRSGATFALGLQLHLTMDGSEGADGSLLRVVHNTALAEGVASALAISAARVTVDRLSTASDPAAVSLTLGSAADPATPAAGAELDTLFATLNNLLSIPSSSIFSGRSPATAPP